MSTSKVHRVRQINDEVYLIESALPARVVEVSPDDAQPRETLYRLAMPNKISVYAYEYEVVGVADLLERLQAVQSQRQTLVQVCQQAVVNLRQYEEAACHELADILESELAQQDVLVGPSAVAAYNTLRTIGAWLARIQTAVPTITAAWLRQGWKGVR